MIAHSQRDVRWQARAACGEVDLDLFFSAASRGSSLIEAIRVCNSCPVQAECREFALADPELCWSGTGIWGGLTSKERRIIRRQRVARRRRVAA